MPYTGIEDVEVDYGRAIGADDRHRVLSLIERAEALITQRVPDLASRITAGRTSATLVRQVVAEMVTTKLRNPEGYMQRSHTVTRGPFSESTSGTIAGGVAGGGGLFMLTRRHLQMLGAPRGAQSISAADPALRRVVQPGGEGVHALGEGLPEGVPYGYLWPEQTP